MQKQRLNNNHLAIKHRRGHLDPSPEAIDEFRHSPMRCLADTKHAEEVAA